jgi:hypothetical protein
MRAVATAGATEGSATRIFLLLEGQCVPAGALQINHLLPGRFQKYDSPLPGYRPQQFRDRKQWQRADL